MKILNSNLPQGSFLLSLFIAIFSILNLIGNIVLVILKSVLDFLFGLAKIVVDSILFFVAFMLEAMEGEMKKKSEKKFKFRYRFRNALARRIRIISLYSSGLHSLLMVQRVDKNLRKLGKNRNCAGMIVLMAVIIHIVIAVAKISVSFNLCGGEARAIFNACTANPNIPIADATMVIYKADCKTFDDAQVDTKKRTIGLAAIRDDAWTPVYNHVKSCMAVAQSFANDHPDSAVAIIESGGFKAKKIPAAKVNIFKAENNGTSGSALLTGPGAERGFMHEYQKSINGALYVDCGTSIKRKLTVTGITPISAVWFRHRVTKEGFPPSDWEYAFMTASA